MPRFEPVGSGVAAGELAWLVGELEASQPTEALRRVTAQLERLLDRIQPCV